MPEVRLPISRGLVTDQTEGEWLDFLPVNLVTVPKPVLGGQGYMRSWPGLTQTNTTAGGARGGVYNTVQNITYRIAGTSLINSSGQVLVDVGGLGLARMPFSVNSQAIVSAGRLRFFRDDMLTDLRNWEMGERNSEQMSDNWSPDYRMGAYARIPVFMPADGAGITAEVTLTDNQAKQWVFGSDTTNADEAGIFVENGAFFVQLNTSATPVNIGAAIVGNNTLTYSNNSAAFNPGISLFGAQRINSTLGEFLTGRIFNVRLSDTDMPENSRAYSSVIREAMPTEGDRNANRPTDLHILDSLNTPNTLASMGTVEVIGGAMGSPAVSGEILATGQLVVGNFYSVNCSVATDGMGASGWSAVNGIPSRAMVTGAGSVFEVFRAVSNNVILTLFTENTAATFTKYQGSGSHSRSVAEFPGTGLEH